MPYSFRLSPLYGPLPRPKATNKAKGRSWLERALATQGEAAVRSLICDAYKKALTHSKVARALGIGSPKRWVEQLRTHGLYEVVVAIQRASDRRLWL